MCHGPLRFCNDLHVLKVDLYHVEQPLKQFWSCLNDWNLFSIVGQRLLKNVIYDLWKSASPEVFYSPLFAVVHYFFDRVHYPHSISTHLPYIQVTAEIVVFIRKLRKKCGFTVYQCLFDYMYIIWLFFIYFIYLFSYLFAYLFIYLFRDLFIITYIFFNYLFIYH